MNSKASTFVTTASLVFSLFIFASLANLVYSAPDGSTVIINEVQISGTSASDEFVELYNPTESDIDMTGWRLTRLSSTGTESNLDSSLSGIISAGGYYLLTHANYDGTVSADEVYSTQNNISSDGAVRLYSDAGITLVDTVGFGESVVYEASAAANPMTDGSASRTSGVDTDNNFDDFVQNELSDPQNSASVSATPTPTESPTESPTSSPSASPTAEPSESPSPSPTSTPIESPTPSSEPTETPTSAPTVEPTESPSPSPTAEPTTTPTATPSPTSTPTATPRSLFLARFGTRECRLEYRMVRIGFMRILFPRINCS